MISEQSAIQRRDFRAHPGYHPELAFGQHHASNWQPFTFTQNGVEHA